MKKQKYHPEKNVLKPPAFPPLSLAGGPYYITGVNRAVTAPKLNGKGDDACWQSAAQLKCDIYKKTEDLNLRENSWFKLLWDDDNLYFFLKARAKDIEKQKAAEGVNMEYSLEGVSAEYSLFRNDHFEIFIDPGCTKKNYYHLAGNVFGKRYERHEASGCLPWESGCKTTIIKGNDFWTVEASIPFHSLGLQPQGGDVWGFNACRDNPAARESSAWRPLQSFQTPALFGKIIFLDDEYLGISRKDQMNRLCEGIYGGQRLLKEACLNMKTVGAGKTGREYFGKVCLKINNQIVKCKKALASSSSLDKFCKNSITAGELNADSQKLLFRRKRANAFFPPGSAGALRGYEACVENPMTKISPDIYPGSPVKTAALQLAGREYGSFQLAVFAREGSPLKGISIKMSALTDTKGKALDNAKFEAFMVDYIRTAKPNQSQEIIADALLPGKEFKFERPLEAIALWFDIYLPPDVPAGKYRAAISLTPAGCQRMDIPVLVDALPFSLPLKASLSTAFCFVDYWAEGYYRGKMPRQKRREYIQFILDHRLEPMNYKCQLLDMSEDELAWAEERGKSMLFLRVVRVVDSAQYYRDLIKRFKGRLKPIFFGHDEVLGRPAEIPMMKADYALAKEQFPEVPRLNTARIDERLYGYVNIWCPLFSHYNPVLAKERLSKGEQVWWYTTDRPLQPYANFNLDSPGIDPRVIPWMNWKLGISGLLYWALNREWPTNYQEAEKLTSEEKKERGIDWITPEIRDKIKKGLRWPKVPWLPFYRSVLNTAVLSSISGAANLMYPGPDWKPLPSIRLKNLRDGLQDYEYFIILKKNVEHLKRQGKALDLAARAETALKIGDNTVKNAASYTKDPAVLIKAKQGIAALIIHAQDKLRARE